MHVQKLSWNNRPVDPSHVTGDEIVPATVSSKLLEQDGVLRFVMRGEEEIPFSRPRGTDTLTDTPASVSAAGESTFESKFTFMSMSSLCLYEELIEIGGSYRGGGL